MKKQFNPQPYIISGILLSLIPIFIFIIFGNIYQYYEECSSSITQILEINYDEFTGTTTNINCITIRALGIVIPICFLSSIILLFYSYYGSKKK